jgi:hypothetical protein
MIIGRVTKNPGSTTVDKPLLEHVSSI